MRISDWSSDVCSSDLGLAGLAVEPRAAPSAERRAGYSQQQRVENGAVDASGHRHACARDGEDDEVERLVDRTLFRRGTATQLQPDQRPGPRESGKAAENAAADAARGVRWARTPGADGDPRHTAHLAERLADEEAPDRPPHH